MSYQRQFIQSVADVDSSLQQALLAMASDLERVVERGSRATGERVSEAQMLRVASQLQELVHELWGDLVPSEIARMTALARQRAEDEADAVDELLARRTRSQDIVRAMRSSQAQRARRVVQVFKTRERSAKFELSQRVWKWEAWSNGRVQRALSSAFARGLSNKEIAREVRHLVDPSTPGGVSYAAQRLGRTEVADAFHRQTIEDHQDNPFIVGLKWNLSKSHLRRDGCNVLTEKHSEGLPEGVYRASEAPDKPHPQCMCHLSPEVPDEETFQDEFLNGGYNDYLLSKFPDIDLEDLPSSKPAPAAIKNPEVKRVKNDNRKQVDDWWGKLDDDQKSNVRAAIREKAEGSVNLKMTSSSLFSVLKSGRFKTAHEVQSGASGDQDYLKIRKDYEDEVMGLSGVKQRERPIYGFMGEPGDVNAYGDYAVTFKDRIKNRTTVSVGDSLNGMLDVHPLSEITRLSDPDLLGSIGKHEVYALKAGGFQQYMEVQLSDVRVSDIDFVTAPSDISDDLREALERTGIEVRIQLSEEEELLAELARKLKR